MYLYQKVITTTKLNNMKNLQELITKSNEVKAILSNNGIVIDNNILIKVYSDSMELILCEDGTMAQRVFGGEVTVNGYRDWKANKRDIQISSGSMGGFTPDCVASTTKIFTQAAILNEWSAFCNVASALMNQCEAENQLSMLNSKQN